jgi:hypothetical protein
MRGLALTLLIGASAVAVAASAADFAAPPRKPGLWKQTIATTHGGKASPPMSMSLCIDASVDKQMTVFSQGMGKQVCSSQSMSRTATGFKFASVCSMGAAGTISSEGALTGDLNKSYKMDVKGNVSGAAMAAMNGPSQTTITSTWSGPCPATMHPGDMTMANGMQINILGLTRR